MTASSDQPAQLSEPHGTDAFGRVLRIAAGLSLTGILIGGLTLVGWPILTLIGAAFVLGVTQLSGY